MSRGGQRGGRDWGLAAGVDRRTLLATGAGAGLTALALPEGAGAQMPSAQSLPAGMLASGTGFRSYGIPSEQEVHVQRLISTMDGNPVSGGSVTPLHQLEGVITPSGLHYERHHNGVPDIDVAAHRLVLHGLTDRALSWSVADLKRYPLESHCYFVECAGNSARNIRPEPMQASVAELHGLISVSEWTGVRLAVLLAEAGVADTARWIIAEGADGASYSRSIPLEKGMEDALVALYQNGEAIRPEQGYPLRLILPGFEGSTNIKWLHRIKLTDRPAHSREETSRYSSVLADGKVQQFDFVMGVKSVIVKPSFGLILAGPGRYEISGLAWSGRGRVERVDVSVDGGRNWALARLDGLSSPKSAIRFRLPWQWDGKATVIMSRAVDDHGNVQPTREAWLGHYNPNQIYHNNMIQAWTITPVGQVRNVYV